MKKAAFKELCEAVHEGGLILKKEILIQELVKLRFRVESGIQKIFVLRGKHEQDCIKLLEIDCNTIKAGIVPIYERFKDSCVIIISIDPVEFYNLKLPYDWKLGKEFTREKSNPRIKP